MILSRALLVLGLAALAVAAPPAASQGHPAGTVEYLSRYLVTPDDASLIDRDGRLGFDRRFSVEARELLDLGEPDPYQAAVAHVALGAGGMAEELERLRAATRAEDALLRRAGVVALGELGAYGAPTLQALLDDPELGALARLCLLRSGAPEGRVELLRRFRDDGLSEVPALIEFVDDPAAYVDCPPEARTVFELRFGAARSFGLVDGQRWGVHLTEALAADPSFLDLAIFLAAAESREPVVKDLVLERLVEEGGEAPLRAAARCMPEELRLLMASDLYTPGDDAAWAVLLDELERRGLEAADLPVVLDALARPTLELRALRLLVELGGPEGEEAAEQLRDLLADPEPLARAEACRGLGATGDALWVGELSRMGDDASSLVRGAALVARGRLGHGPALADLREIVADPEPTDLRRDVVRALCADASEPLLGPLLRSARETALGAELLSIRLALRLEGDLVAGRELNEVLERPSGTDGRTPLIIALARDAVRQDMDLLEQLFPSERHPNLNAPLAAALTTGGTPEGMRLLRMALWRGPWDRSQLAAVALVDHAGLGVLVAELESAPTGVTADAFRRVGYAVGMLGGLDALDQLLRRRGPADPALQGAYLGALASRTF